MADRRLRREGLPVLPVEDSEGSEEVQALRGMDAGAGEVSAGCGVSEVQDTEGERPSRLLHKLRIQVPKIEEESE